MRDDSFVWVMLGTYLAFFVLAALYVLLKPEESTRRTRRNRDK